MLSFVAIFFLKQSLYLSLMKKTVYVLTGQCNSCGLDSMFPEEAELKCNYCGSMELKISERKEATAQLLEQRLKELSDRMFSNLQSAYDSMTEEDKAAFPEGKDAEKELLMLLEKAKKFKESISGSSGPSA